MATYAITTESGKEYEITTESPSMFRRGTEAVAGAFPGVGQFVGGVAGGYAGSLVGHPVYGSILGGTIGRGAGTEEAIRLRKEPIKSALRASLFPVSPIASGIPKSALSPQEYRKVLGETGKAAVTETAFAPVQVATAGLGRGLVKAVIPKPTAQRGLRMGFARMLNPKYYDERMPQDFVKRASGVFDSAKNRYGEAVESAVANPDLKNVILSLKGIKQNIRSGLREIGIDNFNKIDTLDISKRDKTLLKRVITDIYELGDDMRSPRAIWNARRKLDKIMYSKSWRDEAIEVLNVLRRSVNEPLRKLPGVKEAFNKYSFIMDTKDMLKKKVADTVIDPSTGAVYSPSLENWINSLMSPKAGEVRGLLSEIDPQLAQEMFDAASAKVLARMPGNVYPSASGLLQNIISPKIVASVASKFQSPVGVGSRTLFRRGIPTALSSEE